MFANLMQIYPHCNHSCLVYNANTSGLARLRNAKGAIQIIRDPLWGRRGGSKNVTLQFLLVISIVN